MSVIDENDTHVLQHGFNYSSTSNNSSLTQERKTAFLISGAYLTIVGSIAIAGNVIVLLVIVRDARLRGKSHNLLLINLACADLLCLVGGYPLTTISGYLQGWYFGLMACKATAFFTFFMSLTSMNTLVAICVFRYVMICFPGKAFLLTRRATFYIILLCWLHSLFWTSLPLLGWGGYGLEPFQISCSLTWGDHSFKNTTYLLATILFCYILHISTMIKCYRSISQTVKQLAIRDRERNWGVLTLDDMLHKTNVADDRQVTRMCFFVVIVFVGVWTPYTVICLVHTFYSDLPLVFFALPTMAAKAGCMLNPLVYFATNRNFRKKALEMLCCHHQENAIGVDVPNRSKELYDKTSKDGVYLGQQAMDVVHQATMF